MCSKGKPVTRHMMIEKAKSFYDEMSKTEKWTLSEGSSKILPVRTLSQQRYCLIIQNI
jgi:hypothetical protein